jgi:hypothetical protein
MHQYAETIARRLRLASDVLAAVGTQVAAAAARALPPWRDHGVPPPRRDRDHVIKTCPPRRDRDHVIAACPPRRRRPTPPPHSRSTVRVGTPSLGPACTRKTCARRTRAPPPPPPRARARRASSSCARRRLACSAGQARQAPASRPPPPPAAITPRSRRDRGGAITPGTPSPQVGRVRARAASARM